MSKNQLFRIPPELSFIKKVLTLFGLDGLHDTKFFSKESIKDNHICEKILELEDELKYYYLPCKYKVYVRNIDERKCITILRQLLKSHNYTLISKEKYFDGTKMNVYRLIKSDTNIHISSSKKELKVTINFD